MNFKSLVPISLFYNKPENGWDPVTENYATEYAEKSGIAWKSKELDELSLWANGLSGKRVLDLGAGPGTFSIPMAKKGAHVFWHDASRNYQKIAKKYCEQYGLTIDFQIGRLEDIAKYKDNSFDVIFSRVAWYYNVSDKKFSQLLLRLLKPGGIGYISTHTREYSKKHLLVQYLSDIVENIFSIKLIINHKPRSHITTLFARMPVRDIYADYSTPGLERIIFKKKTES